ncbi:sensor domain-containing diguanylate cyclase [Aliiglaciecola sp. 3_MG-2023]|uniref:sensor domain-containing diguanylate cyclase n=1 Tax=Aliiglaciecola sp. 3_MG-2023 TaxID=3062644 RepID=UPI0026E473CC|nr:sensor domain-containing diguanylate cyclase [Aliiglaciecola sp. 3_MG-2023]MDO6694731.1 sensor domain-containing diguanylate cyclase [Aliiglaciecola sp. 3_MG-2023]
MNIPRSLPLRILIVVPFTCLLISATAIFAGVSYNNNRAVAIEMAHTFNELISQHLESYINNTMELMPTLVLNNAQALKKGVLSSDDPLSNSPWLLNQLRQSDQLNFVTLAFNDGGYIAASRPPQNSSTLEIATNLMNDEMHLQGYSLNKQDLPSELHKDIGFYDPRLRPFMRCAITQPQTPCWGKVYQYLEGKKYAISFSRAIRNEQNEPIAVAAVDMSLNRLSEYINKLKLNNQSIAFLFEQDGTLLASTKEDYLVANPLTNTRFTLSNHPNTLLNDLAAFLHLGSSEELIELNNRDYVVTSKDIQLGYGKVWKLAVLQPLDVTISVIKGKTSDTIILILATLLGMIALGAAVTKLIAKPIENISKMALDGALDELEKAPFQHSFIPEVRRLSSSLARLASAQIVSITQLEQRVVQRTTELEKANVRLLALSQKDPLTGIANRRVFDETYRLQWALAQRQQSPIALILCDVDQFKAFNDNYGHQKGDAALIRVASSILKQIKRPTDLLARYGGEEFILVLPQTDEKGAWEIAERIRKAVIAENIPRDDQQNFPYITLSVGFASMVPTLEDDRKSLLSQADQQLYIAKANGRNQSRPRVC